MYHRNPTRLALFGLGFLSIGTQIYLVREFMMVFNDNELVIGLVLASWMMITGIGSYLGRFISFRGLKNGLAVFLLIFTGILPSLMVFGLDLLKFVMVPYGSMAGLWQILGACVIVQFPFCLMNGVLFYKLSIASKDNSLSESYAFESLGSMLSGAMVNFIFLWLIGPFRGLLILTVIYLLLITWFIRNAVSRRSFFFLCSLSLACVIILVIADFRKYTERLFYPSQEVISDVETPYGQVVITGNENQYNYFENGMLLFSSGNEISNEENVHFAMIQHPHPERVLLISGGFSGTLTEILKYRPQAVDYVDLDPSLISIGARYTGQFHQQRVKVHETDARKFLRTAAGSYDVVLVNLPSPSTLQLNRYYTREFLMEARRKMFPGAVIAYSLPSGSDYLSGPSVQLNSVLWCTLKQCFSNILIVPSERNFFLASDSSLSLDIPGLIQKRGIETKYVNNYYLDTAQLRERSAYVTSSTLTGSTTPSGSANYDFTPVAVWCHMSWWLSIFNMPFYMVLMVFAAILFLMFLTLKPLSAGLFAGGFTLASTEIMLIIGLQVLCGYLFQAIGAIIMIFMLGLAAGSGLGPRICKVPGMTVYILLQVVLGLFAILVPLSIIWLNKAAINDRIIQVACAFLAFTCSVLAGMEYKMAGILSESSPGKTVASNYSAEMFGSAAGAFAVSLFLIPSTGIVNTGIIAAALNIAAACILVLRFKHVRI